MSAMFGFIDTEETIHPVTPDEAARYEAAGREYAEDATAILAEGFGVLTGNEIHECECAVFGEKFDAMVIDRLRVEFSPAIGQHRNRRVA